MCSLTECVLLLTLAQVLFICVPLYVCLICVPDVPDVRLLCVTCICALYVCPCICALYVFLTGDVTLYNWTVCRKCVCLMCMSYMWALYVRLICAPYRRRDLLQLDGPYMCALQGTWPYMCALQGTRPSTTGQPSTMLPTRYAPHPKS